MDTQLQPPGRMSDSQFEQYMQFQREVESRREREHQQTIYEMSKPRNFSEAAYASYNTAKMYAVLGIMAVLFFIFLPSLVLAVWVTDPFMRFEWVQLHQWEILWSVFAVFAVIQGWLIWKLLDAAFKFASRKFGPGFDRFFDRILQSVSKM